ncbi:zinc ribbon domain-containing protein [Anaerostipes butyraticus]|uniref:Zinc-ribbon domain-containing protein n=1 Tax=Anaerostipes butyraticus TaxID=645466 RepID=A0A916VCY2_9FIRM|nr:zinc ribbon domain-containing protein [Anaerostipes butyraticus]GFO84547.1 hypothetical protein ANBU17_08940 [Anaerostipes butyraticus]HJC83634.1 zinc ribbon domain-containing protein [Candidatus Anaerostipes avicola]
MICPECRAKNPDDARFCGNCGYNFQNQMVETEQEKKKKERKKIILYILVGIVFAITAAAALLIVLDDTGSGANDVSDIALPKEKSSSAGSTETSADSTETSAASSEEKADSDLPEIVSNAKVDYNKIISLHDYKTFYADGYSFGFPLLLYERVEEFGDNGYRFSSSSDPYSWLEFQQEKRTDQSSIEETAKERSRELKSQMTGIEEILDKPEKGVCIFAGSRYNDENQKLYHLLRVEDDCVYNMTVGYPDTDDKELDGKRNYYIDCLYRMCSFSGGTYKPRTYDQFLSNDMGTKK